MDAITAGGWRSRQVDATVRERSKGARHKAYWRYDGYTIDFRRLYARGVTLPAARTFSKQVQCTFNLTLRAVSLPRATLLPSLDEADVLAERARSTRGQPLDRLNRTRSARNPIVRLGTEESRNNFDHLQQDIPRFQPLKCGVLDERGAPSISTASPMRPACTFIPSWLS